MKLFSTVFDFKILYS